jgi:hypothetical protein
VQAVLLFSNKGETAPFDAKRVWSIAREKYNAAESLQDTLKAAHSLRPDRPLLQAIQERLLYEKVLEGLTRQLESGTYNPDSIIKLLENQKNSTDSVPIHRLSLPSGAERLKFICRTGIREVDNIIGGVGSELVIVAAPPKNGKSNFFINLVARQPLVVDVIYISIADYGLDDLNHLINVASPGLAKKKSNLYIVDLTGYSSTLNDVESVIKRTKIEGVPLLTVVDRAEKMRPMGKYDNEYSQHDEIFTGLRRLAKRYDTAMFVDSQYGSAGMDFTRRNSRVSSEFLYGDRTVRQSIMDLFFGVRRNESSVTLFMEGRRQGRLPASVDIQCNELGVYK